jgi:hypothetical protein
MSRNTTKAVALDYGGHASAYVMSQLPNCA